MNQLQQVELHLLQTFIEVCEILQLRYFLVCGTALGAAKYSGFIPWDDDIDVALPREDYNKFVANAHKYLPPHVFLQSYKSDKFYPSLIAKLRDCNTTFMEKTVAHIPMNHGVYIDIFALDGYPSLISKQRELERKKWFYKLLISSAYNSECSFKIKVLRKLFRIFGIHRNTSAVLSRYEALISQYPTESSKVWCNHGNWQGKLEYAPIEHYGDGVMMKFEGLDVRIPEKYDDYLSHKYGNWQAELPEEEQVGHHYYSILDLNKPYTVYSNK